MKSINEIEKGHKLYVQKIGLLILILMMTVLWIPSMAQYDCPHTNNKLLPTPKKKYDQVTQTTHREYKVPQLQCNDCHTVFDGTPNEFTTKGHFLPNKVNGHTEIHCACGYDRIIHNYTSQVEKVNGIPYRIWYRCPCGDVVYSYLR